MRMIIACCLLVSSQYFKLRKALAVGIITSGGGIGTLTIPYLLRLLFDHMTYSETMLIYGKVLSITLLSFSECLQF